MRNRGRALIGILLIAALVATACGPEAERSRGGGAGADVGNRTLGPAIELHGRIDPLWNEPEIPLNVAAESR